MENLRNEIDSARARTPLEKALKKAVLSLLPEEEEKVSAKEDDTVSLEIPVSENNKDVLVAFAGEHGIEVEEPQNKKQYIEAVSAWLEENS